MKRFITSAVPALCGCLLLSNAFPVFAETSPDVARAGKAATLPPASGTAPLKTAAKKPPQRRYRHVRRISASAVVIANRSALQEPSEDGFLNAVQIYPFMDGAAYKLYAAPGKISDIVLQSGEQLVAISAGDTARWIIGDTYSGSELARQVHILVKPLVKNLKTNLVITTSIRTYHIQAQSTDGLAMMAMSWTYPQGALTVIQKDPAPASNPSPTKEGLHIEDLNFGYQISGDSPSWRPKLAFDDGRSVYIEFPKSLATSDAPPLFLVGKDGSAQLVNYRVEANRYVVDHLFEVAELRLGTKRQILVRITRIDPHPGGQGSQDQGRLGS